MDPSARITALEPTGATQRTAVCAIFLKWPSGVMQFARRTRRGNKCELRHEHGKYVSDV